ncbi:MAG TPA: hypothetical protein VMI72_00715, partial [Roseiarcus sp.]|nr:hypothetical protein [Roseiarcus sp.]
LVTRHRCLYHFIEERSMPISFIHQNNTRSREFRFVFSDTTAIQFMGNQAILTFGVVRNPANPDDGAEEQIAVAMTSVGLKSLSYSLNRIIDNFEKTTGSVIPLPDSLIQTIDQAIESAPKSAPKK